MAKGKYQTKKAPMYNFAMRAAVVLFLLVIITTYLSAGLFAKYSTKDDGGDRARVIQFNQLVVAENGVDGSTGSEFIFMPGVNLDKNITVSFGGSEAATFVLVALDVRSWQTNDHYNFVLEQGDQTVMSWSVNPTWKYIAEQAVQFQGPGDTVQNGMRYVYYVQLDPNEPMSAQQVITDGTIIVSDEAVRADYAALAGVSLNLNVTAYAVQANGFYNDTDMDKNAIEAWTSLSAKEVLS